MSDVNKEIDEVAGAMEKSTETPKDALFKTLLELGADGIKEKLIAKSQDGTPLLSDEERTVLVDALTEMKKAKSPSMDADYQAKYVRGNVYKDTIIQEDKADDDADERLVKPANAKMKHQGDNQPEGFEGQVIKAHEDSKEDAKQMKQIADKEAKEEVKDHNKKMHKDDIKKAKEETDELLKGLFPEMASMDAKSEYKETKDDVFRKIKRCAEAIKDMKEHSYTIAREVKDIPEAKEVFEKRYSSKLRELKNLAKEYNSMKKAIDISKDAKATADEVPCPMDSKDKNKPKVMGKNYDMEKMKKMKKSIEDEFKAAGTEITPELVKGEMKKRLLKEEDQLGNDETEKAPKARGDKSRPEALKVEKENDAAQKKVNDLGQGKMKKAMGWAGSQALLAANTGGRNHNFSVNGYYDEALKKAEEANKPAEETLAKAEGDTKEESKPMDINDIIEKSLDQTRDENIADQLMAVRDAHVNPKFVKSFSDNEIADALGLTEEEAKKILG